MATFNTAFGSLPSPKKDLFGNAPMGGDDDDPTKGFAPGSTTEKTAAAPPPTNTFADLQKQGVARPAPRDTSAVSPEFDAAAMTPMLSQLQERLPEAAPVAPMAAPAAPMAAPEPPPEAAPETPPMLGQLGQSLGAAMATPPTIDKKTDTATYTNVEVPVSNAPQYKAGTVPPSAAPNGSTFVSGSGVTWTKQGGVWNVQATAGAGNGMPAGYAALVPSELYAQSQQGGGAGVLSSEPGQGSGLYQFLRKYGTPTSEDQFALLAQNSGKTVEQLKSYIASQPANTNFGTKQDVDTNAEEQAWKKENKVGTVPYNYAYVPASEGGPKLRKKSYEEMLAAGYEPYGGKTLYDSPANDLALAEASGTTALLRAFGGLAGPVSTARQKVPNTGGGTPGTTGGIGGIGGGGGVGGGGTPATGGGTPMGIGGGPLRRYTAPAAPAATPIPDYAASSAEAPQFSLSAQSQALRDALQARLAELGSGPTKIQGQSYEALRAARQAELGAKYGAERSKLEDELAARGLSASTIGGGRYGDLAGQQARALGTLDAELLGQQAEAEARDRAQYLNTMQQFAQTAGAQDIGTFEANVRSKEVTATINLRAAELQQRAALEGRSMDLQQARDQATSEYQMGQLALNASEFGETKRRNLSTEGLQREELAERKRSGLAGEQIQRDQLGEEKRRNDVLDRVQTGQLTLAQGGAVSQLISDIYAGRVPAYAWESTLRALGLNPANFTGLKPEAKVTTTTTTTTTTPGKDDPNNPANVIPPRQETAPPATTLSNYTTGTRFNIRGVIYTLDSSGRLIDPFGKQYNYPNDE